MKSNSAISLTALLVVFVSSSQTLGLALPPDPVISIRVFDVHLSDQTPVPVTTAPLLKLWAICTDETPKMPITPAQVARPGVDYIEYSSSATNADTRNPEFDVTWSVPSTIFNSSAYVVVEVHNEDQDNQIQVISSTNSTSTFIAGILSTVDGVHQHWPRYGALPLTDANGAQVAMMDYFWL